jgi:hypothetical protein
MVPPVPLGEVLGRPSKTLLLPRNQAPVRILCLPEPVREQQVRRLTGDLDLDVHHAVAVL